MLPAVQSGSYKISTHPFEPSSGAMRRSLNPILAVPLAFTYVYIQICVFVCVSLGRRARCKFTTADLEDISRSNARIEEHRIRVLSAFGLTCLRTITENTWSSLRGHHVTRYSGEGGDLIINKTITAANFEYRKARSGKLLSSSLARTRLLLLSEYWCVNT